MNISPPNTIIPQGHQMQAQDRLEELKAKRTLKLVSEREQFFKKLPAKVREMVLEGVALYELQLTPSLLFRELVTEYDEEIEQLEHMLYGKMPSPDFSANEPPHPFPALFGISYKQLSEWHGMTILDETVGG